MGLLLSYQAHQQRQPDLRLNLVSGMLFQTFQSDSQPRDEVAHQEAAYFRMGKLISIEGAYTENSTKVT